MIKITTKQVSLFFVSFISVAVMGVWITNTMIADHIDRKLGYDLAIVLGALLGVKVSKIIL
jgi:hypothetical protein